MLSAPLTKSEMPVNNPPSGSKVFEASLEGFIQFQWRPRPPTLLRDKDIKDIKKNMKSYTRDFEIKDKLSQSKASKVQFLDKTHL